jgi:hypothetical protein
MNNRIDLAQRRKDAKVKWNTLRPERESAPCADGVAGQQRNKFNNPDLRAFASLRENLFSSGDMTCPV